jgi:hypothetical protein
MNTKDILYKCVAKLSKDGVGVDNLYKFFMPSMVKITIIGATGLDVSNEEAEAVSDLYKEKFASL